MCFRTAVRAAGAPEPPARPPPPPAQADPGRLSPARQGSHSLYLETPLYFN